MEYFFLNFLFIHTSSQPLEAMFQILRAAIAASIFALPIYATVPGIDVSDFTTGINWSTVKANGIGFVYIKATEGTSKSWQT